ncbi:MAG: hypothetical protein WC870_03265 [Candidatus Paceibacterota bacterium]
MKYKTPVEDRISIEIDGTMRRLGWVAENHPQALLEIIWKGGWSHNYDTNRNHIGIPEILSAFAKIGLKRWELIKMVEGHPEWKIDSEIFREMIGIFQI